MIIGRVLSVGDTSTGGMSCWVSILGGRQKVYGCGMHLMLGQGSQRARGSKLKKLY